MAASDSDLAEVIEELRLDYDVKCNELVEAQQELRAARLEAEELRLRLSGAGGSNKTSLAPTNIQTGSCFNSRTETTGELRHMLRWIASRVDLGPPKIFDAACDALVNDKNVRFRRVAQWRLNTPGDLAITVPADLATEIMFLLLAVGCTGDASSEAVEKLLLNWDIVAKPSTSSSGGEGLPVFMMADRKTAAGIIVASWPVAPASTNAAARKPAKDRSSSCPAPRRKAVAVGDRVDVHYDGSWYAGAVHMLLDDADVYVQCDADPPGVLTPAKLADLRALRPKQPAP